MGIGLSLADRFFKEKAFAGGALRKRTGSAEAQRTRTGSRIPFECDQR